MAPPVKNWRILWVQSFTAHMPLLTATSTFGLGRRRWSSPQQCYLHCLRTIPATDNVMSHVTWCNIKRKAQHSFNGHFCRTTWAIRYWKNDVARNDGVLGRQWLYCQSLYVLHALSKKCFRLTSKTVSICGKDCMTVGHLGSDQQVTRQQTGNNECRTTMQRHTPTWHNCQLLSMT